MKARPQIRDVSPDESLDFLDELMDDNEPISRSSRRTRPQRSLIRNVPVTISFPDGSRYTLTLDSSNITVTSVIYGSSRSNYRAIRQSFENSRRLIEEGLLDG